MPFVRLIIKLLYLYNDLKDTVHRNNRRILSVKLPADRY